MFFGPKQSALTLLFVAALLQAQQATSTVTYEQTFPGSEPEHYVVAVTANCRGTYVSNGKLAPQSDGEEPFHFEFTVSQTNCAKIFDLTKRAHYFDGEIDLKKKNLAMTGTKTLAYKDAQKSTKSTYNYSTVPAVQELTAFFQRLGGTLEFGHRLEFDHHYQKLALDQEMKRMEQSVGGNALVEVSAIATVLHQIAEDPSVIQVVRARAERMLAAEVK